MLAAIVPLVVLWQLATRAALSGRWRRDERGDVPGWVMIVVMTAAIVVALTAIAKGQLQSMLRSALDSVTGD
jgi:thiol:disulfide interchange protein